MELTDESYRAGNLHPLHAILLAFLFPLTLGGLLSDLAYDSRFQVQWHNFAEWLIAGSLVAGVPALLWEGLRLLVSRSERSRGGWLFASLLAATAVVNFVNALIHSKDGYATMPAGLILSVIGTLLALATSWIGYSGGRPRRLA